MGEGRTAIGYHNSQNLKVVVAIAVAMAGWIPEDSIADSALLGRRGVRLGAVRFLVGFRGCFVLRIEVVVGTLGESRWWAGSSPLLHCCVCFVRCFGMEGDADTPSSRLRLRVALYGLVRPVPILPGLLSHPSSLG